MCTIAFAWQVLPDAPIAVAANRDEALDRESHPPRVLDSDPDVVAPQDAEAGGTWIGVTERGLLVAITNRWTADGPPDLHGERSRGLLVRDALRADDADAAVALVREQVREHAYAGFNLLIADEDRATYLEWDGDLREEALDPGVHVIVNPGLNEVDERAVRLRDALTVSGDDTTGGPSASDGGGAAGGRRGESSFANEQRPPTADTGAGAAPGPGPDGDDPPGADRWLDAAADLLRDHDFEVCIHRDEFGTRSSSLVSIDDDRRASYRFADGPPCETDYAPVDLPVPFLDRRG